jgi:repressor LexA
MVTMSNAQIRLCLSIMHLTDTQGYPPTQTEIASAMGYASTFAIRKHIERLVAEKIVSHTPGAARSVKVLQPARVLCEAKAAVLIQESQICFA